MKSGKAQEVPHLRYQPPKQLDGRPSAPARPVRAGGRDRRHKRACSDTQLQQGDVEGGMARHPMLPPLSGAFPREGDVQQSVALGSHNLGGTPKIEKEPGPSELVRLL